MTRERADVVIVGGGLIGCALAAELAGRGRTVTVVEKAEPGAEASGAAAGMLTPQADAHARDAFFDLALESRDLYASWVPALAGETGVDVAYRRTGFLRCRFETAPAGRGPAAPFAWQREAGLAVLELGHDALAGVAGGGLSPAVRDAVFFPGEAVVDPRRLTRAAWLSAARRGAVVRTGTSVLGFRVEKGVCRGVDTEAGPFEADAVVDAAGAWAAFEGRLPVPVPVGPVRGQIVQLAAAPLRLETIVASDEVYVVPRPDGTVLLGSTVENVGFDKSVTAEGVARLTAAAVRLVPALGSARFLTAWSGLRPGTPDGLPVLGRCAVEGLYFAAGHFRNGILLAPVTARILADLLTGGPVRDLSPYAVERFAPERRIA